MCVPEELAKTIPQWSTRLKEDKYISKILEMAGGKQNRVRLVVPSFDWTLSIVIVSSSQIEKICETYDPDQMFRLKTKNVNVLFVREEKSQTLKNGVNVSSWVKGDPQVTATRVTYDYVSAYKTTYGKGYGSRIRSTCIDSVNCYRDKRFSSRAQPSPLICDSEIEKHQYFSAAQQRSCLLQMKLESILHNLTHDVSCVAERINPYVMSVTSGLSTKQIATTGLSTFAFWNGLHVDSCDVMNSRLKLELFSKVKKRWQRQLLNFPEVSFPTTCGYQFVWKNESDKEKYTVKQHFIMQGLGLAVLLEDSICHHFMGGAFTHCTAMCVLEETSDNEGYFIVNNKDDIFRIFAWGSAANSRTARGNAGQENSLGNYRRQRQDDGGVGGPSAQQGRDIDQSTRTLSQQAGGEAASERRNPERDSAPGVVGGHAPIPVAPVPAVAAPVPAVAAPVSAVAAPVPYQGDDDTPDELIHEDDEYENDESKNKKRKGKESYVIVSMLTITIYFSLHYNVSNISQQHVGITIR